MTVHTITTPTTAAQLKAQWEAHKESSHEGVKPTRLPLKAILRSPEVFQCRAVRESYDDDEIEVSAVDKRHVEELVRVLVAQHGKGESLNAADTVGMRLLAPVVVFRIGTDWHLIDGYHRCAAYKAWCPEAVVPVEVYQGTFDQARLKGLSANSQDKLPMSKSEKTEAAWRFVVDGVKATQQQIGDAAGISLRSVSTMARVFKRHREEILSDIANGNRVPWEIARFKYDRDEEPDDDYDPDERAKEWARQKARQLRATFGDSLHNADPEWVLLAINEYSPHLHDQIVNHVQQGELGDSPDF